MTSFTRLSAVMAIVALSCAPVHEPAPLLAPTDHGASLTPSGGVTAAQPQPNLMSHIPEATFQMGSEVGEADELPVHTAHVAAFDMDRIEVTVAHYSECVNAGVCTPAASVVQWPGVTRDDEQLSKDMCNEDRADRQDHAVNCVDWSMADTYCRSAGKRLPTEEEWEYAACGGNCNDAMRTKLGHSIVEGATRWAFTSPVPSTAPGPFGLYDMADNVWEWTSSPYCPYDHPGCADNRRGVRGGSWSMVDFRSYAWRIVPQQIPLPGTPTSASGVHGRWPWKRPGMTGHAARSDNAASDDVCCRKTSGFVVG